MNTGEAMIEVLYFADREVKQKLFARVTQARKLLMVTTVAPHRAAAAKAHKEPFGSLERNFGDVFDQVLVVDQIFRYSVVDNFNFFVPGPPSPTQQGPESHPPFAQRALFR